MISVVQEEQYIKMFNMQHVANEIMGHNAK